MANEDSTKSSTNLKVPPLKIVLSSHQNNAVVSKCGQDSEDQSRTSDHKSDCNSEHFAGKDSGRRASLELKELTDRQHKRGHKASSSDRAEASVNKFNDLSNSSSSSSPSSDRSTLTSPTSESESLASNSTIISEIPLAKPKTDRDETVTPSKPDRATRFAGRGLAGDRSTTSSKEHQTETPTPASSRDHNLNANQRITRSSQRAAQQVRFENPHEQNGDEAHLADNQDKVQETVRKVKRRRNEPQEAEQDPNQILAQPTVMANIYPADYQLPSQNSFELYRDIRKRPYKKISKLNHIQPKVPQGFKDYLLNCGPYLLDGNKLGVGLNGSKIENLGGPTKSSSRVNTNKIKYIGVHRLSKHTSSSQRHISYIVPKICPPPKTLVVDSPLHELFIDQEKARQQMRMQHLKERERSTLAAEQEILRTYNRSAVADIKQKLHLSACTYFFYQERYHYIDCKTQSRKTNGINREHPNQESENTNGLTNGSKEEKSDCNKDDKVQYTADCKVVSSQMEVDDQRETISNTADVKDNPQNGERKVENSRYSMDPVNEKSPNVTTTGDEPNQIESSENEGPSTDCRDTAATTVNTKKAIDATKITDSDSDNSQSELFIGQKEHINGTEDNKPDSTDEEIFLGQLQEVDDKWDKIRKDMLVRHRNESDSLHAVQILEWEWKAKETGACDVRVSLKVAPEFVPRVDVLPLDY